MEIENSAVMQIIPQGLEIWESCEIHVFWKENEYLH